MLIFGALTSIYITITPVFSKQSTTVKPKKVVFKQYYFFVLFIVVRLWCKAGLCAISTELGTNLMSHNISIQFYSILVTYPCYISTYLYPFLQA